MNMEGLRQNFHSEAIKSDIYDKVFSGEVDCASLDDVYRKIKLDPPEGYRGRSLFVSDVVEVLDSRDIDKGFYYRNVTGFSPVSFDSNRTKDITDPNMIAVLYIAAGEPPKVVYIKSELEDMQRLVGGCIEEYMPFDDRVAIICNDEGKMSGLPLNRAIYDMSDGIRGAMMDIIAGNFFLVNAPYESEHFKSLTPAMIKKYSKRFQYPESFMKINNEIVAIPIKPKDRGHDR